MASFSLARARVFVEPPEALPLRLIAAVALPASIFLTAYALMPAVQRWVEALDMAAVVGVQTWRVIGVVFVVLWAMGTLPAAFALTAGLGDIAVGVLAIGVTLAVARRVPGWQGRVRLLIVAGMIDFVGAFGTAILVAPGRILAGGPTAEMMQVLPLALIPAFGVPLFMIIHLIAWLKLRSARHPDSM